MEDSRKSSLSGMVKNAFNYINSSIDLRFVTFKVPVSMWEFIQLLKFTTSVIDSYAIANLIFVFTKMSNHEHSIIKSKLDRKNSCFV